MSHNADQPGIATNDAATMAKLRKSLKQCQRRALQEQQRASKLTPSEIRALNSTAASSGQRPSRQGSAHSPRRHATPPDSPIDHQNRHSRTSTTYLPTPPQSPKPQHGSRPSSYVGGHQPLHGYLSHPRPRERTRSDMGNTDRFSTQRWSTASASSASLRSLPTYRGHEMTHAGSMNMLRRPSLDIVNNPLSMFSRPRQASVNPAPDPRRSSPDLDPFEAQTMLDGLEAEEREAASHEAEQPQLSRTVSPVSTEEAKTPDAERFSFVEIARGPGASQEHVAESQIKSIGYPVVIEAKPPPVPPQAQQRQVEKTTRRRFSFHSVFSEKPAPAAVDKTSHRRTVAFIEQTETITDPADYRPDEVVGEKQAPSSDSEMATPLPVRPHSIAGSDNFPERSSSVQPNGHVNPFAPTTRRVKALTPLAIPKAPAVYGQCKCCGKLKRPVTFSAELSPVPENENLRTNFGSEIERSRASLDAMTSKRYTSVIPMEGLDERDAETVRASREQPVNRDMYDDVMEPRQQHPKSWRGNGEPRLVRFASLHGLNVEFGQDDDSGGDSNDEVEVESTPVVEPIIAPRGYQALPSMASYNLLETKDSLHMLSTASLETAEQVSMATLRPSTLVPRPAKPVEVNPRFTPAPSDITLDVTSEQQLSKPATDSSLVETRARVRPSPRPVSEVISRPRPRSSLVEEWYMNAIRQGPKQDVITVVGWDHHKSRRQDPAVDEKDDKDEQDEQNEKQNVQQARPPANAWPLPETRVQAGRTSFDTFVQAGNRRHSSTSLGTLAKEQDVNNTNRRRSMLLGLFSRTNSNSHAPAGSPAKFDNVSLA